MMTFLVECLDLGSAASDPKPKKVVAKVKEFAMKEHNGLRLSLWDLKEFFPNVELDEIKRALVKAIEMAKAKMPTAQYF